MSENFRGYSVVTSTTTFYCCWTTPRKCIHNVIKVKDEKDGKEICLDKIMFLESVNRLLWAKKSASRAVLVENMRAVFNQKMELLEILITDDVRYFGIPFRIFQTTQSYASKSHKNLSPSQQKWLFAGSLEISLSINWMSTWHKKPFWYHTPTTNQFL